MRGAAPVLVEQPFGATLRTRSLSEGSGLVEVDGIPPLDERGLTVAVVIVPARTVPVGQVALAHGEDGTGWWLGLDAAGRPAVGAVTTGGPAAVSVSMAAVPGEPVRLIARIPGRVGELLQLRAEATRRLRAEAVLGRAVVRVDGPLRWGARSLRDGAESPFSGRIADVALAPGDLLDDADGSAAWPARWQGELIRD